MQENAGFMFQKVTWATLYIVTVRCSKQGHHRPSWGPPHNPLTLPSNTCTMFPSSVRNRHAGSIGHATDTFGRWWVRISAWTQGTMIFSVSPCKFREGTLNQTIFSQFQIKSSHNSTAP